MTLRQRASSVGIAVLFVPVCVLVYHLTAVGVGALAEPLVAPTSMFVIIDHFHVEVYLEAVFLAAALVAPIPRVMVWSVGVLAIPTLPVWFAVWNMGAPTASLGRSLGQDATLWALEGVGAGLLACTAWEVARRTSRQGSRREVTASNHGGPGTPPNEGMNQSGHES